MHQPGRGAAGLDVDDGMRIDPGHAAETCPDDPSESGGVDWWPNPAQPVFYGYQDLDESTGAPRPLRIWYPSVDGHPEGAGVLKLCLVRWPLVLFLHGEPPPDCRSILVSYYRSWSWLPTILARAATSSPCRSAFQILPRRDE